MFVAKREMRGNDLLLRPIETTILFGYAADVFLRRSTLLKRFAT